MTRKEIWAVKVWTICVLLFSSLTFAQAEQTNLLKNGGFEHQAGDLPVGWSQTHHQMQPLAFSPEHYEGKMSGLIVGDGMPKLWRQSVMNPPQRSWMLSAMVKTEGLVLGKNDYCRLYAHVYYKGQAYASATHFYKDVTPGSNDWERLNVLGAATSDAPIEKIDISILGKFSKGRVYVDDVMLTTDMTLSDESLLQNKIDDLRAQIARVGEVDESVARCVEWLDKAEASLAETPADLGSATSQWHSAAKQLSHTAWAAMYPQAMADKPIEARMMYHGMGATKAGSDAYLDKIELAGCNAVYLSFGSWMFVNYHSDILPVDPAWQDFDALTYFIEEAHKRGIKVFGYYACFYGTSSPTIRPGSLAELHPEWLATGPDANMPTFPDPANPEVLAYMLDVYRELATRYDLDGIGLDYIRYPTPYALNYDENNRQRIKEQFGIDILTHPNITGDPDAWAKVQQYRREVIGNVVEQVTKAVREVRPGISVMACLISEIDMAREEVAQDWPVSSQWIDYASPMNYDDRALNDEMLEAQRAACEKTGAVWIPAIGGMPKVHRQWTISDWAQRVAKQREHHADGIIIYRIGEFDTAVAAFFGKGPFFGSASFPEPVR